MMRHNCVATAPGLHAPCCLGPLCALPTCCMPRPLHDVPHRAGCWRPAALVILHAEVVLKLELLVLRRRIVEAATARREQRCSHVDMQVQVEKETCKQGAAEHAC